MLSVKDIRFSYGNRSILDGISFDTGENEIISVLGPNGTGKTTMLKCICNILKPDSGEVSIDGLNALELTGRELSKHIGFVPQTCPVTRMTVYDSVLIGRRPYIQLNAGMADLEKTSAVIDAMGLGHLSLRYMNEISGGEFQKVQIARAIVQEPSLLILDEPTNNLDISNQHVTMKMIEDTVRSRGICTIMTMHDINLAIHYSDRFIFLKDGKVLAAGGSEIITAELIKEVYGMESEVIHHRGAPIVVPMHSSRYKEATG